MSNIHITKLYFILALVVVSVFVYIYVRRENNINDLIKNGIIVNAKIEDCTGSTLGGSGANPSFVCVFMYKKEQKRLESTSTVKKNALSYIGRTYPAIYSEKTNTIALLMFAEDFKKYHKEYPDSLMNSTSTSQ